MGVIVEVIENTHTPIQTSDSNAVVEVVNPAIVVNAVVSETEPVEPFEGQVWIDIS